MIIVISFLLLAAAIAFLFLVVVFPIWTIIDCAVSQRPNGEKIAWIICMILFGFIAGFCYVIWGSKSNTLRFFSFGSFILVFFLGVAIIAGTISLVKIAVTQVDEVLVKMDEYTRQLSVEQTQEFRTLLVFLSERLQNSGWRDLGRRMDYIDVADQLNYVARDNSISELDYMDIKDMIETIKSKGFKLWDELSGKEIQPSEK